MNSVLEIIAAICLLAGAFFALVGSIGLARLPDFYMRLHSAAKATTLGVGGTLLASAIWFSTSEPGLSLHEMLITLFLFITSPVSTHMLAKAGLHLRLPMVERTRNKPEQS